MSGGQQAQLALTLALARRPQLLVLDEPMAMLDPVARHDFMATVMTAVADDGVSVVLSSHVLAELERVADYLVLLSRGSVQMVGEVDDLLATPPRAHRPSLRVRAVRGASGTSCTPAVPRRKRTSSSAATALRSGASGMGGALAHTRRADPCLPARARRRGAARSGPCPGRRTVGGDELTALTVPAPHVGRRREPATVPWRRMAWVTWRQHRTALIGVAALFGALALCFWIVGLQLHHAYAAAIACHPASSFACNNLVNTFNGIGQLSSNGFILQAVPALIGAFVGAPVLARELETGTFRFAWTQGFGRWRWTLAKLVALGVVVTAAAGALSVLFSWYYQPYFLRATRPCPFPELVTPLAPGLFDLRGVRFAAWTLAAFAIGALAGVLIRRVVPAIVATLVVYAGLAFATGGLLRSTTWRRSSPRDSTCRAPCGS